MAPRAAAAYAPDPLLGQQWGLRLIHALPGQLGADGAGAVVAVIDTGVDLTHPDLAGRLLPGWDFADGDGVPEDLDGHGTNVTGIIAADAGNGIGVAGAAPRARVMPLRVIGAGGNGSTGDVARAVDYAVAHGADVISMSLNMEANPITLVLPLTALDGAIRRALAAGVIVVASAGNRALPLCEQPVAQHGLLCVGAVRRDSMHSGYSNYGVGVGVVAPGGDGTSLPGHGILSTWLRGGYAEYSGTSQATPFVSGVAALLVSLGMRGQAAVQRIVSTARDLGPRGYDPTYAHGLVDARAALAGLVPPPIVSVRALRHQHAGYVRRHGLAVSCRSNIAATCRIRVYRDRRAIGHAAGHVSANRTRWMRAKLDRRGRRGLRRHPHARLKVVGRLADAPPSAAAASVRRR